MQTIIVGHHSRIEWVGQLQAAIPGALAYVDFASHGALNAHFKALQVAQEVGERCVIIEDDAIPVQGFEVLVRRWCDRFPDSLISFYLGTGRPVSWQARVDAALIDAAGDHIVLPRLIHGVCYSIPAHAVARVLQRLEAMGDSPGDGADYLIGRAWGKSVVYPVESLVQHRDDGSVEIHPDGEPRIEQRVARALAAPLAY